MIQSLMISDAGVIGISLVVIFVFSIVIYRLIKEEGFDW